MAAQLPESIELFIEPDLRYQRLTILRSVVQTSRGTSRTVLYTFNTDSGAAPADEGITTLSFRNDDGTYRTVARINWSTDVRSITIGNTATSVRIDDWLAEVLLPGTTYVLLYSVFISEVTDGVSVVFCR